MASGEKIGYTLSSDVCVLQCDAVQSSRSLLMFQRNLPPSPSGIFYNEEKGSKFLRNVNYTRLHSVTYQKTLISI
jgi:hypothetical protein